MNQEFKKGSIVPRRLRMGMCSDKKSQHALKFGCDVMISGRNIYAKTEGAGAVWIFRGKGQRMNNGTYKNVSLTANNVSIYPYWAEDKTAVFLEAR